MGIFEVSSGGVTGTVADPKLVFVAALKANACNIIISHNHPSGNLKPSLPDEPAKLNHIYWPSGKDKAIHVQKVKLADEDLVEVTGIKAMEDGKHAVAEYTTAYKNVSGFSALTNINFNQTATRKANFTLYDDAWRLEKKK